MRDGVLAVYANGESSVNLRRALAGDVPALAALFGDDPVSAARGDSGAGDLTDYEQAFAAIDGDERHLLVVATEGATGPPIGVLN